jgi:hypothetical protein
VIGSNNPASQTTEPALGQEKQANPPFVEELVAALAVRHFANDISANQAIVRIFEPAHCDKRVSLAHLPWGQGEVASGLGYLLNLAAFFLRVGDKKKKGECHQGLWQYLATTPPKNLADAGWFDSMVGDWIQELPADDPAAQSLQNASGRKGQIEVLRKPTNGGLMKYHWAAVVGDIAQYFGRLLLWSGACLSRAGSNESIPNSKSSSEKEETCRVKVVTFQDQEYVSLHNGLCSVTAAQIKADRKRHTQYLPQTDNSLIRLLRGSLVAMLAEEHGKRAHRNFSFRLLADGNNAESISVGLRHTDLLKGLTQKDANEREMVASSSVNSWFKKYWWTEMGPVH